MLGQMNLANYQKMSCAAVSTSSSRAKSEGSIDFTTGRRPRPTKLPLRLRAETAIVAAARRQGRQHQSVLNQTCMDPARRARKECEICDQLQD